MRPSASLLDQDDSDFLHTVDVNLGGTYRVTKAFLPLMLESPPDSDKTVVVLTSIGAQGVQENAAPYSIAKFALCRFSQFLMEEYGEKGVLSYAFHPGGILTPLARNLPENLHGECLVINFGACARVLVFAGKRELLTCFMCLQKVWLKDTPELASHSLAFLTSKKRTWLGGRYISANWDMPELVAMEEQVVGGNLLKFAMRE